MISLRTLEGTDLAYVAERFGADKVVALQSRAARYIGEGKLSAANGRLVLSKEGKLLADGIAADLFF